MEISDVYWKDTFIRLKCFTAAATAKSLQSCPTLCDPIDGSPSGSTVPGILQARTLEWVAISFSNAWKWKVKVKSLSHVRLCDPMDCGPPGSSIHGILQARVLEWGAIAFSNVWLKGYKNLYSYNNKAIWVNMHGPRDNHTKWSEAHRERQTTNNIT